jgi:hypothetical protein
MLDQWYGEPNAGNNAIGYAQHCSRSHDAVICAYDDACNVIETHEHTAISASLNQLFSRLARTAP